MDNLPCINGCLRELALFAGAGGGILGGQLLGWRTVCAVEIEPYAASVLVARQNDGLLPPFPIWDEVQTFNGRPWRGIVDVVSGGFPCQDISISGKGEGITGERSGLWMEMARIIGEVRPRYAFVENSPVLTSRGLGVVLGDLAAMGFDARWGVLGATDVGAPIERNRMWILARADQINVDKRFRGIGLGTAEIWPENERDCETRYVEIGLEATTECAGVVDGMADWVERTKAIGNGQVPQCAAAAWRILNKRANQEHPQRAGRVNE